MIGSKLPFNTFLFNQDLTAWSLLKTSTALAVAVIISYVVITELYRSKIRLNIPGPTGFPIVGNLYQLSPDPADTLHKWSKKFGGVYQIMLGNRPVVVFSNMQAARDVFIGQANSLIDKPVLYTFHSVLSSVASSIGTTPWSESTKRRRKTAASAMNKVALRGYLPFIDELTNDLIRDLLREGREGEAAFDPKHSISKAVVDLTMSVNYGARLPKDDALLEEIIEVEDKLSRIKTPLGSTQDFVPILRSLPFNKTSATAKEINRRRLVFLNRFSAELKVRVDKGDDSPSIVSNCVKDPEAKLDDIDLLSISMSMVSGGLDTMVNTLSWTIGTLARRKDIQDKAYAAIEQAYGSSWGPIEDDNGVPYITALVKECLRSFCVLRLSLPRAAWKDINYGDLFIPKGTMVFLNSYGCNRDMSVYGPDVDSFRPERFLDDPDLPHAAYGFGTRMCAGFHLANRQLYVIILRLIWAFEIQLSSNPADNTWQVHPLKDVTEPWHLAAAPSRYLVRFKPRSRNALDEALAV